MNCLLKCSGCGETERNVESGEKGQWIEFGARKLRQANKETGNEDINSNETGRQVVLEVDEGQAGRGYREEQFKIDNSKLTINR